MSTAIPHGIQIPGWVVDLDAFRRWARSDAFPDEGRICYLNGAVWVDMSKEELFSHNQVKAEYTRVLASIAKKGRRGRFWPDGARISNVEADISNQPDGIFVLTQSRQRIRRLIRAEETARLTSVILSAAKNLRTTFRAAEILRRLRGSG